MKHKNNTNKRRQDTLGVFLLILLLPLSLAWSGPLSSFFKLFKEGGKAGRAASTIGRSASTMGKAAREAQETAQLAKQLKWASGWRRQAILRQLGGAKTKLIPKDILKKYFPRRYNRLYPPCPSSKKCYALGRSLLKRNKLGRMLRAIDNITDTTQQFELAEKAVKVIVKRSSRFFQKGMYKEGLESLNKALSYQRYLTRPRIQSLQIYRRSLSQRAFWRVTRGTLKYAKYKRWPLALKHAKKISHWSKGTFTPSQRRLWWKLKRQMYRRRGIELLQHKKTFPKGMRYIHKSIKNPQQALQLNRKLSKQLLKRNQLEQVVDAVEAFKVAHPKHIKKASNQAFRDITVHARQTRTKPRSVSPTMTQTTRPPPSISTQTPDQLYRPQLTASTLSLNVEFAPILKQTHRALKMTPKHNAHWLKKRERWDKMLKYMAAGATLPAAYLAKNALKDDNQTKPGWVDLANNPKQLKGLDLRQNL